MCPSKQAVSAIFISLLRLAELPVEAFSIGQIPTTNQLPDSPSFFRTISQEQQLCAALEKFHKKQDVSKRSRYDLERTDHGQEKFFMRMSKLQIYRKQTLTQRFYPSRNWISANSTQQQDGSDFILEILLVHLPNPLLRTFSISYKRVSWATSSISSLSG